MVTSMRITGVGGVEETPKELAQEYAETFDTKTAIARQELREAMQTPDDAGGYLVSSWAMIELAVRLGMPRLPDRIKWDDLVHAKIGQVSRWWRWLFRNYSTNKIASFLVWRWPKFPDIVEAYDVCCRAHQEETERRKQKAYEFFQGLLRREEDDCQADLD